MKNRLPRVIGLASFIVALTTLSALARPYSVMAAECVSAPARVWATTGPGSGQATISWDGVSDASSYAVVYGTKSGSYIYGGDPIGEASSRQYTVNALQPGGHYYFRVIAKRGNCPGPWSAEVHTMAGGTSHSVDPSANMMVSEPTSKMKAGLPAVALAKAGPVGKQGLWAKSGPNQGEVTLYWQDADSANNYHLMYGAQAGSYSYGALNIGNVKSFIVRQLAPGKIYHFALVPMLNGRPLYTTPSVGVSAYVTPPPIVVQPENQAMELMPIITPTPARQGGIMQQQSLYDDEEEVGDYDDQDEDELYEEDDDEDDEDENGTQGYMMNQEQTTYEDDGEEEQMAQQYLPEQEASHIGSPNDPIFE